MNEIAKILIVEDEPIIRTSLHRLLERNHYLPFDAASAEEAVTILEREAIDLIITDIRLPGESGLTILKRYNHIPVLVITSYASVRGAVDAMKKGAIDYLAKPFDHQELLTSIKKILSRAKTQKSSVQPKSSVETAMQGMCPAMQNVFDHIRRIAPTDATVLILGESGTGKELVARAIHERSPRSGASLITVNCAAIPETLIETELFGHEKGAFTGALQSHKGLAEAAEGGTLFLDEIGELPPEAQARLLRLLQEGEIRRVGSTQSRRVNIRLIAATHRDLKQLIATHAFREDLYFRLRVMEIKLPPLRERGGDIDLLTKTILTRLCARLAKPLFQINHEALDLIKKYTWPGNIRELENTLERAVILCEDTFITPDLLDLDVKNTKETSSSLDHYFKDFVLKHQDTMTETEIAEKLGLSRKSLWKRRQRFNIPRNKKINIKETIDTP